MRFVIVMLTLLFASSLSPAVSKETIAGLRVDEGIERVSNGARAADTKTALLVPTPRPKPSLLKQQQNAAVGNIPLPRFKPDILPSPKSRFHTGLLTPADKKLYINAYEAAKKARWRQAFKLAEGAKYQLPGKILKWRFLLQYNSGASFDEITGFMAENPDWPNRKQMRRRAEESLKNFEDPMRILAWFADRTPQTGMGMLRLGEALRHTGRPDKGLEWIRQAWTVGNFHWKTEKKIYKAHRKNLRRQDHEARLDRLIWAKNVRAARRMLKYVGKDHQKLADARLRLMTLAGGVDAAIARVPDYLQDHAGLNYERAKWRRRKNDDAGARALILSYKDLETGQEKWWVERHIQIRKLLKMGHITDAYTLASKHGLKRGGNFATAEWLAGWVALRFLTEPEVALRHFTHLYENVKYPISRARGAYWAGRAAAAAKDRETAEYWYETAAQIPTTYYGQLATFELKRATLPALALPPITDISRIEKLVDNELVLAIRLLAEIGNDVYTRPFIMQLVEMSNQPEQHYFAARLAAKIDRQDYAVAAAKRSAQKGIVMPYISWPTNIDFPENAAIERPLILAITRQESAFSPTAISRAGARGLMQLMPATAKSMSRMLKLRYSKQKLVFDPQYNLRLGSEYLGGLIGKFDGSYVLAIAGYNAGPSRINRWLKDWGDPRSGEIDILDWIELIPYSETRNYVQRVIENLQIYRQILDAQSGHILRINHDLTRGDGAN